MAASWMSLCDKAEGKIDEKGISVTLGGRSHFVSILEDDDSYLLRSVVLGVAAAARVGVPPARIWEMNRSLALAGFRFDAKGRLIGESTVPKIAVTREEFRAVVKNLAAECDRYEYMFTGRDQE